MTRISTQISAIVLALFMTGAAYAQDPVGDKIKAKAKDFFESAVELEIQGGVYRIITVNPRAPGVLIDLCQAMDSFSLSIGAEMFDTGTGPKTVTLDVKLRVNVGGKPTKGTQVVTLRITVGETRSPNAVNPDSFTRARDGDGVSVFDGKVSGSGLILMVVGGRGSATTIDLNGGNGGNASVSTTEKRTVTIAVGGNGGTSNSDQKVGGLGGDADSKSADDAHAIAIGGRSGHTFGKGGNPPVGGKATAISTGNGRADACGGGGGDAGPGDAETNTAPGTGGTGGKAIAKINFPGKNKSVLSGPVAFARGGKGGDGGHGADATSTAGMGGAGGISGDSQSIGNANFVSLDPQAVKGGTGGKGGTGNPPGDGGPGGAGGKAFKNDTEVGQGATGAVGPQGDTPQ